MLGVISDLVALDERVGSPEACELEVRVREDGMILLGLILARRRVVLELERSQVIALWTLIRAARDGDRGVDDWRTAGAVPEVVVVDDRDRDSRPRGDLLVRWSPTRGDVALSTNASGHQLAVACVRGDARRLCTLLEQATE